MLADWLCCSREYFGRMAEQFVWTQHNFKRFFLIRLHTVSMRLEIIVLSYPLLCHSMALHKVHKYNAQLDLIPCMSIWSLKYTWCVIWMLYIVSSIEWHLGMSTLIFLVNAFFWNWKSIMLLSYVKLILWLMERSATKKIRPSKQRHVGPTAIRIQSNTVATYYNWYVRSGIPNEIH